ncbi:hypothetical protein B0A55_01969 [Friedmanniomyces simplex]|uniref:Rpr2-domain-containing protein n=1 Tax=Friedmanniomyces simplex TaxID=329884 RepID=A0A4U0XME1_9PEZI|nr:hypothetical protein B0A55_01969 [Friedmanniomyces simplex]
MAKDKTKSGVSNRHLHARISYLQQAATYLTVQGRTTSQAQLAYQTASDGPTNEHPNPPPTKQPVSTDGPVESSDEMAHGRSVIRAPDPTKRETGLYLPPSGGLPLHLASHLKQIARKAQIRLHTSVKHALCPTCSTVLVEGETCTKRMENLSRGGRKPHADVLVVECTVCGAGKTVPVGAARQKRKGERAQKQRAGARDQ